MTGKLKRTGWDDAYLARPLRPSRKNLNATALAKIERRSSTRIANARGIGYEPYPAGFAPGDLKHP